MFNYSGHALLSYFHKLLAKIGQENLQTNGTQALYVPYIKKRPTGVCQPQRNNIVQRGLQDLTLTMNNLLEQHVENTVGPYQTGVQRNKSTINLITTLRQTLEKTCEFDIDIH